MVDLLEPVRFLDQEKNPLQAKVKVGSLVPVGHYAQAGAGGRMVILLSNGTLLTLKERTKMRIGTFEQEPFDPKGRKVSDLEGEPSVSQVEIELIGEIWWSRPRNSTRVRASASHPPPGPPASGNWTPNFRNPGQGMQLDGPNHRCSPYPGTKHCLSQGGGRRAQEWLLPVRSIRWWPRALP